MSQGSDLTEPDGADRNGDRLAYLRQLEDETEQHLAAIRAAREEEERRFNAPGRPARERAKLLGWTGIVGGIAAAALAAERSLRQHVLLTATAVAAGTAATISLGIAPLIESGPTSRPPAVTEPGPPQPSKPQPFKRIPTPDTSEDATPPPPSTTESPTPTPETTSPTGQPATSSPTQPPTSSGTGPGEQDVPSDQPTIPGSESPSPPHGDVPPSGRNGNDGEPRRGLRPSAPSGCVVEARVPTRLRLRVLCARSDPPGIGEREPAGRGRRPVPGCRAASRPDSSTHRRA